MAMVICADCGFENIAERKTCKKCGRQLDTAQEVTSTTQFSASSSDAVQGQPSLAMQSTALSSSRSEYEYLAVPFVGKLRSGIFNVENASSVTAQLQGVINQHVSQGWDFHSMEKINIQVTPGCLAGLLGSKVVFVTFDQIIFRRAR